MLSLVYNLWNDIIEAALLAHEDLFRAMAEFRDDTPLSKEIVADLKRYGIVEAEYESWNFSLRMDSLDDKIDGFKITLIASLDREAFEEIFAGASAERGILLWDIEGFEAEHDVSLYQEFEEKAIKIYNIFVDIEEDAVFYSLVLFDSSDIDNNQKANWMLLSEENLQNG